MDKIVIGDWAEYDFEYEKDSKLWKLMCADDNCHLLTRLMQKIGTIFVGIIVVSLLTC